MCELRILSKIPGTEKKKLSNTQTHQQKWFNSFDKARRNFVNFANLKRELLLTKKQKTKVMRDLAF